MDGTSAANVKDIVNFCGAVATFGLFYCCLNAIDWIVKKCVVWVRGS